MVKFQRSVKPDQQLSKDMFLSYCYCFIASFLVPQVLQNDAKGRSLPNCPDSFAIFSSSTIAASKSVRMRRRSSTGPGGDVSEGVSCSSRCQRRRNLTPNKSAKVAIKLIKLNPCRFLSLLFYRVRSGVLFSQLHLKQLV